MLNGRSRLAPMSPLISPSEDRPETVSSNSVLSVAHETSATQPATAHDCPTHQGWYFTHLTLSQSLMFFASKNQETIPTHWLARTSDHHLEVECCTKQVVFSLIALLNPHLPVEQWDHLPSEPANQPQSSARRGKQNKSWCASPSVSKGTSGRQNDAEGWHVIEGRCSLGEIRVKCLTNNVAHSIPSIRVIGSESHNSQTLPTTHLLVFQK